MDLAGVLSVIGYVIEVLIGVGLIIFVHELGHFLAAKWAGVKVRRFFFGFAPAITIGKRKIKFQFFAIQVGETKYGIGMLPFGGFVDMAGELGDEVREKESDVPQEQQFGSKTPGQRAIIFTAGAVMNALFAVIFFMIAFSIGVSFVRPNVGHVLKGGPAWKAGIEPGDSILEINGQEQREFTEMAMLIALCNPDTSLKVKVFRAGEVFDTEVTPVTDPGGKGMTIGIGPNAEALVHAITEGSPAEKAGLEPGDMILALEYADPDTGEQVKSPMHNYADVNKIVQDGRFIGKPVVFEVLRGVSESPETLKLAVVPEIYREASKILGIAPVQTEIAAIRKDSPAREHFEEGDLLISVGMEKVYSPQHLRKMLPGKSTLEVRVRRAGTVTAFTCDTNDLTQWVENDLAFTYSSLEPIAGTVYPQMPAKLAGIRPGDRITEIDGEPVREFAEMSAAVRSRAEQPIQVTWEREGPDGEAETFSATMSPAPQRIGYIGIEYRPDRFIVREGIFGAVATGFRRTILWSKRVFLVLKGLFTRRISPQNLAGPVGIFTLSYHVTQYGIGTLLYFLAMISINLAIINIFPIPVLDGGHLLFLAIEKIKGSPVAIKTQIMAQTVGLVLLLTLAVFVTYNDIVRLVVGF